METNGEAHPFYEHRPPPVAPWVYVVFVTYPTCRCSECGELLIPDKDGELSCAACGLWF